MTYCYRLSCQWRLAQLRGSHRLCWILHQHGDNEFYSTIQISQNFNSIQTFWNRSIRYSLFALAVRGINSHSNCIPYSNKLWVITYPWHDHSCVMKQHILFLDRAILSDKHAVPATWWRYRMEIFQRYWLFRRGIHHKGQWHRALTFSWMCSWINGWANSQYVSDLRRYGAHRDVTEMQSKTNSINCMKSHVWAHQWELANDTTHISIQH